MKIEGIKNNISVYKINTSTKSNSSVQNNNISGNITTYNPSFYRPNISFKAKGFSDYIPSDILGISEERFNELLDQAAQLPEKREEISKYTVSELSKDAKALEFVNLWERQVPSIASENIFAPFSSDKNTNLFKELTSLINETTFSSTMRQFTESNQQTKAIIKDSQQAGIRLLSYKLFEIGMSEHDPEFKSYLLGASILVGGTSWPQKNPETVKLQKKQFVETTKELIKMGILDPIKLINKISENKIVLTPDKQVSYNKWRENKLVNTISTKSTHQDITYDFKTEQGKALLKKNIETLEKDGFDVGKLNEYLETLGLIYLSAKETNEAQFILELSINVLQKLYGSTSINTVPALDILARTQAENQEYLAARETYRTALEIRRKSNSDPVEIFNNERRLYLFDQQIQKELQEKSDFITFDEQTSLIGARKKKLEHENSKIQEEMPQITCEINELEERLIEFTQSELFKTLPLEQRAAVLAELTKSLSSKLMPIGRILNPIKQVAKEFSEAHCPLPLDLFTITNDSNNLIEAVQDKYGNGSHSELAILEQQGIKASDIDKLKKAYGISQELNGKNSPSTFRLMFSIAKMSADRKDIKEAIKMIGESRDSEINRDYLCQLNTLLMESYMEEAVSASKLSQVESALKSAKEHYLQAILLAPNYKNLLQTISSMLRFIDEHPTVKGDYETTDKGDEYNNFREENYTATRTIDTFSKRKIIEETITSLDKNPGKNNINKRKALQMLSLNLNKAFFINQKKRKITEQMLQLEQQAAIDEVK